MDGHKLEFQTRSEHDKDGNKQEQPPIFDVARITSSQAQTTIIPAIRMSCKTANINISVKYIQALNTSNGYVIFSLNSLLYNKMD